MPFTFFAEKEGNSDEHEQRSHTEGEDQLLLPATGVDYRSAQLTPDLTINVDTTVQDLQEQINSIPMSRREKLLHTLKIVSGPTVGMASVYSTFGKVAMIYHNGLWLLAPESLGFVIGFTAPVIQLISQEMPDNDLFNKIKNISKFTNTGVVGYIADYGFTWGVLNTLTFLLTDEKSVIALNVAFIAPFLSIIPAALIRYSRYQQANGQELDRGLLPLLAEIMRGMMAPSGLMAILQLQGVLSADSYIPPSIMAVSALIMSTSYLIRPHFPTMSKLLMGMINIILENPSLAAMFFAFPNDIYASVNDGEIPESFFYTNLGISSVFLLIMTSLSIGMALSPNDHTANSQVEEITEEECEEKSEEENNEEYAAFAV